MINPRDTRLLRVADLQGLQRAVVSLLPDGWSARAQAIIVPTRSAAESLRRTIENATLDRTREAAVLLPDLVTRAELYARLHAHHPGAPPGLSDFDREVLLRLAADDARREGAEAPFRLRPGLLAAILSFYDELRRRGRSIDVFDRSVRERLEPGSDTDRGAARLLSQTRFLSATFAAFERRVADSGGIDEHGLRPLLLSGEMPPRYSHVVVCVQDQAADDRGLWPADFDLLTRLPGLQRLDVVATERALAAGFHQRLHDALPGIEEQRFLMPSSVPTLTVPDSEPDEEARHFVCRDREEELVDAARWIKERARSVEPPPSLDRTAIVFKRPLPYLYLARTVLGSASIGHQAVDALPLAAEPFAAAMDLVFAAINEEATRSSLVELLGSACWSFADPASGRIIERGDVAALDRALRESKYLGGWDRLRRLAAAMTEHLEAGTRESHRWVRAASAMSAALGAVADLEAIVAAPTAPAQIDGVLAFVAGHEVPPGPSDPWQERHARARGALLGGLLALREAHARFDPRPLPPGELIATIRRWIEDQTFAPRTGHEGVLLLDVPAAAFADVDAVRLVGLVEADWPERAAGSIFYPSAVLRDLAWPAESDRLSAARAAFHDLLFLAGSRVSVSSFALEEDALVQPSPFLEDLPAAGLATERSSADTGTRIFAHEALDLDPVAAEAIGATAGAWLALRRARSSPADVRYHGSIGRRDPDVYAVSRVERFLACPFKYYAGHVLQLEEERADESGLTAQERGQLLHGVFEAFFRAWRGRGGATITTAAFDEAVALFTEVAESRLQLLPEADRALERTYLLGSAVSPGLAARAFAFEIEHGVEVIERLVEYGFDGEFPFETSDGPRRVRLRGKADRIDLLADGTLRVIDYKLGRAPKPGRVLQLPIYGLCAQEQLRGYRGKDWTLGRAGYVAFREKNPFVELGGRSGNLQDALQEGSERFLNAVERIEAGDFPPSPDEPWTCTRCGFPHVCRKDYVGDE